MKYRISNLLNAESTTTAATKTIDLDVSDPISRIAIEFKGTNSSSTPTAHPAKMISKIEVVDGAYVLYSLTGIESQALAFYDEGELPLTINETENDVQAVASFHINFGRWLWDTDLALDPTRFRNLQLKITHNKASGGSAPDAATMSVFAYMFDEKKISPRGYLRAYEAYTYSLTSSAHEIIDLPTDAPLRRILVQSLAAGKMPHEQYNKIKLSENGDSKVPINNESTSSLCKLFAMDYPVIERLATLGTGSAVTYYIASTYEVFAVGCGRSASQTTLIVAQPFGGTVSITNDSSESIAALIEGYCPHGALPLNFGDVDDIADWYDVTGLKSLRLDITAGSSVGSSSTAEIVVQQFRRY